MNRFLPFTPLLSLALATPLLNGQTYELAVIERLEILGQTGPTTTEAPAWTFENGQNGNFRFLSFVEIAGSTPDTLTVSNGTNTYPFTIEPVNIVDLQPYFYDGFDVAETGFDINSQLARQGGGDAPLSWLANVEDQANDYHQQVIGPVLLLAGDGGLTTALVSPDLSFTTNWDTTALAGKKVQAVIDVYSNREGSAYYSWAAMTIGSDAPLAASGQPGSGFSVVLIEDDFGGAGNIIQIWDGDQLLANNIPNPANFGSAFVEIFADDPSDAHPWNGVGSTYLVVRLGGQEVFRYEKLDGGYTSNYVTLEGGMQANGVQLATHLFEDFTVFWGRTTGISLPVSTEIDVEVSYASEQDLINNPPATSYVFTSEAGPVATVEMGDIALPDAQPVKEYTALQSIDPTQDVTISWDPYTMNPSAVDAILEISVSYYDENLNDTVTIWEPVRTREGDLLPGIDPSTTAVTIPANTFVGSASGYYEIFILYSDVMTLFEEGGTTKGWLETVELSVPVQIMSSNPTWAGYPVVDNYADTGDFLGWVETSFSDLGWIYFLNLNKYVYVQEEWVSQTGTWMYIPNN